MHLRSTFVFVAVVAAACAPSRAPNAPGAVVEMPRLPTGPVLRTGTRFRATLDADVARAGQPFTATVVAPIRDDLGHEVLPAGAKLLGRAGDGREDLLTLQMVILDGVATPLRARVVIVVAPMSASALERTLGALVTLGTAATGALVGVAAVGGAGGALKGATVGASAGPTIAPDESAPLLRADTTIVVETTSLFEGTPNGTQNGTKPP